MSTFPGSSRLLKGGIVLTDPGRRAVLRIIALQYNPDILSRSLLVKGAGTEGGDRSEALRLKGPPQETIKLDVAIDATGQLGRADGIAASMGVYPALAGHRNRRRLHDQSPRNCPSAQGQ
jgi:hypothetical protein